MPYINLIYEKRLAARREFQISQAYLFSFVGAASLCVLGLGFLSYEVTAKASALDVLNAQLQKIAPLRKQIDQDKLAEGVLQPKITTLQHAQEITNSWGTVLNHISHQTPSDVWLTAIQCNAQDPTKDVDASFVGKALSQTSVSDYVFRLQNCSALKAVALKFTEEKPGPKGNIADFQIDTQIAQTALVQVPKVKKS